MPDLTWFRWGGFCENFAPETENGKLKKNGVIKCHDPIHNDYDGWGKNEWAWDYDGKNKGQYTSDMYKPKYIVKNNSIILLGIRK